jgi:hypothetical protein
MSEEKTHLTNTSCPEAEGGSDTETKPLRFEGKLADWKGPAFCPSCGAEPKEWHTTGQVYELLPMGSSRRLLPSAVVPLIILACPACHNVQLYSALALGLVDEKGNIVPP